MRPKFVDSIVTEAGVDLDPAEDPRADRPATYQAWRRTRVLFMRSVSDTDRAIVDVVDDLSRQGARPDL